MLESNKDLESITDTAPDERFTRMEPSAATSYNLIYVGIITLLCVGVSSFLALMQH